MAKRLIWTKMSHNQKKEIFEFWNNRNKSKNYSRKLNDLFNEAAELLLLYPNLGKKMEIENVRLKSVRDFGLVYRITKSEIQILTIWDFNRNPETLKNILIQINIQD